MQSESSPPVAFTPVRTRAVVCLVIGVIAALATGMAGQWQLAPLVGWDATATGYVVWMLVTILPRTSQETSELAAVEDPGRAMADGLLLIASVASLLAVGVVVARAGNSDGAAKVLQAGLGVISVVISWTLVHTVFTLRYARLYYTNPVGGVDFNNEEPPSYLDFAYLAYTIGMTFQVSDTSLSSREFRRTALHHALLSYLFGTVIVATTINLVAGLSK